ncbi:hypothetical protein QTP70_004879 [Hemibagrus guttatus]|uniref:Reverse transcriptase domain-containing protein n=1 Tax=Hemibagrus guttatus TaxID=175788 RepID=A0AAE0RA68_9TELE|nr:hypothetical protein QTP70_004879 [Hemibagrus guttatus]
MQLSTVASEEVLQITRSCNPTTCPLDPSPSAMLQTISPDLLPFITTVINGSLTSGHVPTVFKKARVIPILKKPALDPSDISNYRPVSLLSLLSKILERVVCNQLSDYLMQNNLHDPNQSGFKAAHSTETALLAVTEKLHAARLAKLSSVLILLDLSAAFDTVNHKTLLSTLRSLGICGTTWEWFASYLDGRSYQDVTLLKELSGQLAFGWPPHVRQEESFFTARGPPLTLMGCTGRHTSPSFRSERAVGGQVQMEDGPGCSLRCRLALHILVPVDDCTHCFAKQALSIAQRLLRVKSFTTVKLFQQISLVDLQDRHGVQGCTSLAYPVGLPHKGSEERNYQTPVINKSPVVRVDSFRYLGVNITQDLSWSCNINTVVKKAQQRLYHLRCLRDFRLPSKVLRNFYSCTIESILMGNNNLVQEQRHAGQTSSSEGVIREVFEYPARGRDISVQLMELRQGTDTAADYAIKFRTLAAQSGWNEIALLAVFWEGLQPTLQAELACHSTDTTLANYVTMAIRLDNLRRQHPAPSHSRLLSSHSLRVPDLEKTPLNPCSLEGHMSLRRNDAVALSNTSVSIVVTLAIRSSAALKNPPKLREALATKEMEPSLHGVLDVAVKIVNFVKARAINSRLFTALCEEVGADYHTLLMHTDMRWLSRRRVLMCLFSLREELHDFLVDKRLDLAEFLDDDKWLAQLSYLSDMFGKGSELADMMERRKVDLLCVQETRWKGSKAHSIGAGFKLVYHGVDTKRNGVGVVLKEEYRGNVLEVKRVSDRVMSLKLEIEGVMLNVVSGYAPQVGCELEEKERFWSELDEVMESIPTGERVVIGADFNGHVGEGNTGDEEMMGKFGVKERNLEGQMVVDFAKRMDMGVVNTYFQKREEHRVTYKSGGRSTQVDYILCRRGNLKEISDCKVVVGECVARQHRMVVCRMTLMVCKKKRSEIEKKTKWWKLKKEECCEEFRQKLRQALGGQVLLPDDWETTAEVIRETGRKVLGVSSGRRKENKETWWWNEEVQDSIQRKRLAKKKWDMDRTEENRQEYKEL